VLAVVAGRFASDRVEFGIQHADEFRRLVVDDSAGLLVPERVYRPLASVVLVGCCVSLVEMMESIHGIGGAVWEPQIAIEGPALLLLAGNRVGNRDQAIELPQGAIDQRAVRPGATVRHIEMIAVGLDLETGGAVGGDALAELAVGPF
jgi:hypothetical protein